MILSRNPDNPGQAISMAGAADIGGFVLGIPLAKGLESLFGNPNAPFAVIAAILAVVGPIAAMTPEPPMHEENARGEELRRVFAIPLARGGITIGLGFAVIIGTFDAVAARFLKDLGGTNTELVLVMVALFVPLVLFMPLAGRIVDKRGPDPLRCARPGLRGARGRRVRGHAQPSGRSPSSAPPSRSRTRSSTRLVRRPSPGGTIPLGLAGAGQGAYEATYAVGAMTCSLIAPLLYNHKNSLVMWTVAGVASIGFAAATWFGAASSRRDIVHVDVLQEATGEVPAVQPVPETH